jgi:phosphatidylglycerophosphate synthase
MALLTDWTDGWLARRGNETDFGAYADPLADIVFWVWYVRHHEPSRALRLLCMAVWVGPAIALTAAYFIRGRALDVPRPVSGRNFSVGLQLLVTTRALRRSSRTRSYI